MWDRRTWLALADGWLGLVWASLLGELVATVYFASLRDLRPQPSLALLGLLAGPALLALPPVRAVAHRGPLLGAVALGLAPFVDLVEARAALLGVGWIGVSLGLLDAAMTRPRQVADAWLAGFCAALAVRWWVGSVDPIAADARVALAAAAVTLVAALPRPAESRTPGSGRILGGVAFGAATYLVQTWFLGPTVLARWTGFDPGFTGAVLVALALGFAVTASVRAEAAWLAVVGAALLAVAQGPMALVGACVLAFALPSIWSDALVVLARAGPRALWSAGVTDLALLTLQATAFGRDYAYGDTSYAWAVSAVVVATATLAAVPGLGRTIAREKGTLAPARFAAVGAALVATAVGLRPGAAAAHHPTDVAMTWNLQQGFTTDGRPNLAAVAEAVRREGVTVLGLQECDATRPASAGLDPVAALARALGMHAAVGPGSKEASFGLAVLASAPLSDVHSVTVHADHAAVLLATVELGGRPVRVAVTHLGGPAAYRDGQVRAVAAALAGVDGPLLVLGDFNLESAGLAPILEEAALRHAADGGIDHILVRDLATPDVHQPDTGGISDHRPVVATLRNTSE